VLLNPPSLHSHVIQSKFDLSQYFFIFSKYKLICEIFEKTKSNQWFISTYFPCSPVSIPLCFFLRWVNGREKLLLSRMVTEKCSCYVAWSDLLLLVMQWIAYRNNFKKLLLVKTRQFLMKRWGWRSQWNEVYITRGCAVSITIAMLCNHLFIIFKNSSSREALKHKEAGFVSAVDHWLFPPIVSREVQMVLSLKTSEHRCWKLKICNCNISS